MKQHTFSPLRLIIIFTIFAFSVIFLLTLPVHAFELEARISQMAYDNADLKADGKGFEVRATHKNLFAYGSSDPFILFAQACEMYSLGIGYRRAVLGGLGVFLKVGYDMPQYDSHGFPWEPPWFHMNQYLAPTYMARRWYAYSAEIDSAFTSEIGLDYKHNVWRGLSLGFTLAYKFARHGLDTYGVRKGGIPGTNGYQVNETCNFGGYKVGGKIEWRF